MDLQKEFDERDKLRRDALSRGDAVVYASLCDELGVNPEREDLYEQGIMGLMAAVGQDGVFQEIAQRHPHDLFLGEVGRLNVRDFSADAELKRRALERHYGARFGEQGSQPLGRYTDAQVGRIFRNVVGYAERVLRDFS